MKVDSVRISNNNYKFSQPTAQPNFKSYGVLEGSGQKSMVKCGKGIEYSLRVLANKIYDLFSGKRVKTLTKQLAALKPEQSRIYLEQLAEIGRIYGTQKIIDVNIEDNILEQIAKKGDSTIFVMNHSNQKEDPQMLAVLNTLLAEAYKKTGCERFPLPKIILNEDILKTMNPTKRKAFENFGAIGIDASIINSDKGANARAFLPIIKDFVRNNCNIFIFPEGRLATRTDLDFHERFQTGVANLINKILGIKNEVTVVPVGFAYGKGAQKNCTAMNIGTPIQIKRNSSATTATRGDVSKSPSSALYEFFEKNKDKDDIVITSSGEPVLPDSISGYIKTIICENLEINSNIAKEKLNTPFLESEIEIY